MLEDNLPAIAEGRSLSDSCEDSQKMLDCYKGSCDCTCKELAENAEEEDACGDKNAKVKDTLAPMVQVLGALCTGDLTNPCA
jgi:hypothetical protein